MASSDVLSRDERGRAGRFHFERDRLRFVRCRCALRSILSRYLGLPAEEIRFEYSAGGKPEVAAEQNPCRLRFNVSHSSELALIAIGTGHRLGIDIERVSPDVDITPLMTRFFSGRECDGIRALPGRLLAEAFFACWTRKESFLKATGDGLSFTLSDFSVTTHPDLAPALEEIGGDTEAGKHWRLVDLSVAEGYRATVTFESCLPSLVMFTQ